MPKRKIQNAERHPEEGKWFGYSGDWLFPYLPITVSAMRRVKEKFPRREEPTVVGTDFAPTKLTEIWQEVREERTIFYNDQPSWSLNDIAVSSSSQASEVIAEFLQFVEYTTAEFCWTLHFAIQEMDWKEHSWKHTNFEEIGRIMGEVKAGRWLPPEVTVDLLGSPQEAEVVFQRAHLGEPDAIARINCLFPAEQDRLIAARHILDLGPEGTVPFIPSVAGLAGKLAQIAVVSPDPNEAERARRQLVRLISRQAVTGSRPHGGRPPSPYHEETISTVRMMSYAMCKQMRQVDQFLGEFESSRQKRHARINELYPWPSKEMQYDASTFLDLETSRGALELAGKILKLSASKIEKIVYPARSKS